jgi:nitrous oxide reductase accessory protein NosL
MIISDERFAAGLVDAHAKATLFDDTGELIVTVQSDGLNDRRAWVHDYGSGDWIDATTAFYVDAHDIITPMGTGVVAFADHGAAASHAADHAGTVRDWNGMMTEWTMHGHDHGQDLQTPTQDQSQDHSTPAHDPEPTHDQGHD